MGRITGGTNVYSDATIFGEITKIIGSSASILAIGRTDDNQWLDVRFEDGSIGWVQTANVTLDIDINTLEVTGFNQDPHATVKEEASGLRIRQRPGADGAVVTNLEVAFRLPLMGVTKIVQWVRVNTISGSKRLGRRRILRHLY